MLQVDERIGGEVRYVLTDCPVPLMAIPDEVRKCVYFIGYRMADNSIRLAGTAFCMARPIEGTDRAFHYAVTARHVIDHIRRLGISKVLLRINRKSGTAFWAETRIVDWVLSPEGPSTDIAILRYVMQTEWDHLQIPFSMAVTGALIEQEKIGVGDEVFMTGLFSRHVGARNNIPIVRVGNIAAMTGEKVNTRLGLMDAYLIESRSIGGLSGSPVFVNLGLVRHGKFSSTGNPIFYLLGLVHGHYEADAAKIDTEQFNPIVDDGLVPKNVNMGIAIVVPVSKLLEMLNSPAIRAGEIPVEEELRNRNLPTADVAAQPAQPQKTQTTAEGFDIPTPTEKQFFSDLEKITRKTDD